jgi:hypothetical protein
MAAAGAGAVVVVAVALWASAPDPANADAEHAKSNIDRVKYEFMTSPFYVFRTSDHVS